MGCHHATALTLWNDCASKSNHHSRPKRRSGGTPANVFTFTRLRPWRYHAQVSGLVNPILALSGWRTPHVSAELLRRRLRARLGVADDRTLAVSFLWLHSIDDAAERLRRATADRFGVAPGGQATVAVDVVGLSMGGLVARRAAMVDAALPGPRLAIARLFTLGTPHRGAKLADLIRVDENSRQMRAGSAWLARLDQALATADYELVCYARTNDWMVGATRTAPVGHTALWRRGVPIVAHHTLGMDGVVLDDIARRLLTGDDALNASAGLTRSNPPRD